MFAYLTMGTKRITTITATKTRTITITATKTKTITTTATKRTMGTRVFEYLYY